MKRSVNQDDVCVYHLFYTDAKGTPGTDLTFCDWPVPQERRDTRSITRTHLRVAGLEALQWWDQYFQENGVQAGKLKERDGCLMLDFEDSKGQHLPLIDDGGVGEAFPQDRSPVLAAYQVRGLGPILLSVPVLCPTDTVLQWIMNMRPEREYAHQEQPKDTVHVYEMGPGGVHAELHVAVQPDLPVAQLGAGGVHHVASRTPTFEDQDGWAERLNRLSVPNGGKVDRSWSRSLYFREPNGILFEIATTRVVAASNATAVETALG